jgi:hypothetical protein
MHVLYYSIYFIKLLCKEIFFPIVRILHASFIRFESCTRVPYSFLICGPHDDVVLIAVLCRVVNHLGDLLKPTKYTSSTRIEASSQYQSIITNITHTTHNSQLKIQYIILLSITKQYRQNKTNNNE